MKPKTYAEYNPDGNERAARALLTTWRCLDDYHEDLVLVGGLAVLYLTNPPTDEVIGAVTYDVDFGINIGVSSGTFPLIQEKLHATGFKWQGARFQRDFGKEALYLDLLTDDGESDEGTATIDESLHVSIFPGINRALACHRLVNVSGALLDGQPQEEKVRVADVGPLLVLKLIAFSSRKAPKDAHDIAYLAMNYRYGGAEAAIAAFRKERESGNRGIDRAMQCLDQHFCKPDSAGAMACADFRDMGSGSDGDNWERNCTMCSTLGQALRG